MSNKKIKSRRSSNPFLIGLFVIIGSILVIGGIIWLGVGQFLKDNKYFVTYFTGSVEGLEQGSAVKYQGVPVGSVSKIDVAPDGKLVEVVMRIEKNINISDNLRAKVEFAGIAGGKFIQLHYAKPDMLDRHPALSFEPKYKVIASAPSGFDQIELAAKEVLGNFNQFKAGELSDNAITFLQATTKFMSNKKMYQIIDNLEQSSEKLDNILAQAQSSTVIDNLNKTTEKLERTSGNLYKLTDKLNDEVSSLKLGDRLDFAFAKYDSLMTSTRTVINNIGFQANVLLLGFNEAIEAVKSTSRSLKKSLRAVSETPSQIFLSEPPKPEK